MTFEENLINEVRVRPIVWNKWIEDYKNRQKNEKEWAIIARNLNKTTNEVKSRWRNLRDVFQKEFKKVRKPRSGDPGSPNESNYSGKWIYFHQMIFLKDVMTPRPTQSNYDSKDDESRGEQSVNESQDEQSTNESQVEQSVNNWEFEIDNYRSNQTQIRDERNSTESSRILANTLCDDDDDDDDESLAVIRDRNVISQRATTSLERNVIRQSTSTSSLDTRSQGRRRKHNKTACTEFEAKMLKIEEEKIKAFKEKKNEDDDEDMLFLKSLAPYFRYLTPVQKLRLKSKVQNLIADEIAQTMLPPLSSPSTSAHSGSILPSPVHAATSASSSYMSPQHQTREYEIAQTMPPPLSSPSTSAHSGSILPSPVHAATSASSSYMSPQHQTREFYESFDDNV